ncbi:MAG: Flp family type IVb pilin [Planctomycetales bacterium]
MTCLREFLLDDQTAATAVEYAVMLAAILLAVIAAIAAVGAKVNTLYGNSKSEMESHGIQ